MNRLPRPPRPPRPATPLGRLLDRLHDEMQQVPIDPDLPARVEARIRSGPVRPPSNRTRTIPRWAAVAAAVLLALAAGASTRSSQEATVFDPRGAPPTPPAVEIEVDPDPGEPPPPDDVGTGR